MVYEVGIVGSDLPVTENGKVIKEYDTWRGVLRRCYTEGYQAREPTYRGCTVSEDWLTYSNFYNWIIKQDNYQKWKEGGREWAIDKDILVKDNKVYSLVKI